ncbi:hypothetical protein NHX12_018526 [Muraenolepis orangiensis]|uniref:Aftiphilin clathrin-binding box domain-containing protein n=1 Tax=Muraenolepis orangiensis TaxID=630683 RepID=A0A9Q0F0V7_9TELE|nr:hypothetical protein NHX12_018526 [Muraenolepis orangiensis]
MEPDVIRMYSSSPPPLEDGAEEEEDDFGDFDSFSNSVPSSVSFTEFDTPTTFNQVQALNATSPPELLNDGRVAGLPNLSTTTPCNPQAGDPSKANGVLPVSDHHHSSSSSGGPSERTVVETKKALFSRSLDVPGSGLTDVQLSTDFNDEGPEVLTNGFATLDGHGSIPSLQNSVHHSTKGASTEDTVEVLPESQDDEFADFATFADVEAPSVMVTHMTETEAFHSPVGGSSPQQGRSLLHCNTEQGIHLEENIEEAHRVGLDGSELVSSAELPDNLSHQHRGSSPDTDSKQPDCILDEHSDGCEENAVGEEVEDGPSRERTRSGEEETARSEEKASRNEMEMEPQTSLDRPQSTDTPEQCRDVSPTDSAPSPLPQEDTATSAHHRELPEDEEDFGDFDSGCDFSTQGFAAFDQLDVQPEHVEPSASELTIGAQQVDEGGAEDDDDFGDFNTERFQPARKEEEEEGGLSLDDKDEDYNSNDDKDRGRVSDFPGSDSFGNFNSAPVDTVPRADTGWSAFGEEAGPVEDDDSWAAFDKEQVPAAAPVVQEEWSKPMPEAPLSTTSLDQMSRAAVHSVALSGRLERLFQQSFPDDPVPELEEGVPPLKSLLEPTEEQKGGPGGPEDVPRTTPFYGELRADVWRQLLDIHEAFGLRHQWGGSHSNKTLLCSLGIDTRNILFTGQKKQAIIVPMYAASLGMLEPTKEPVKPVSAAEMITSIAQAPPVGQEKSPCPSDTAQEVLPPVQFDWSSSGLTNPLDASGGSSLLNLDFFGPVEDSASTSSPSIPGVDPELYELTTAKLDSTGSGNRVVDAFARLMSTMEKTSTSARKPKKEEHLSEEAAKVISSLPDLSFMQAKVLMFPATLTPLVRCSGATPE